SRCPKPTATTLRAWGTGVGSRVGGTKGSCVAVGSGTAVAVGEGLAVAVGGRGTSVRVGRSVAVALAVGANVTVGTAVGSAAAVFVAKNASSDAASALATLPSGGRRAPTSRGRLLPRRARATKKNTPARSSCQESRIRIRGVVL